MRHYFLGLAADYSTKQLWRHTFAIGGQKSRQKLTAYLAKKYQGEAILTSNGRSALAIALQAHFKPGTAILVNGFTCYAVYEAIKAARLVPIWADINPETLNFDVSTLKKALSRRLDARGIIVQNSLGHMADMAAVQKFAHEHNLIIIEDLAHSAGFRYPDGREAGTVGEAAVFSFGKDKSIDTVTGGAVVLRGPHEIQTGSPDHKSQAMPPSHKSPITAPSKRPRFSDVARARFYPLIGLTTRVLTYVHLSGPFMRLMLKMHFVEKSADSPLDVHRQIPKFVASLALRQFENIDQRLFSQEFAATNHQLSPRETTQKPTASSGKVVLSASGPTSPVLRDFYLVEDRDAVLTELQKSGYYFGNFWYEKPVSPARYYKKVHFPEEDCPVATLVAASIVNFPTYYPARALKPARKIVKYHELDASTFVTAGKVVNVIEKIEKTKKKLSR